MKNDIADRVDDESEAVLEKGMGDKEVLQLLQRDVGADDTVRFFPDIDRRGAGEDPTRFVGQNGDPRSFGLNLRAEF